MKAIRHLLIGLALFALAASLFSLIPTNWWLIRALDMIIEPATYVLVFFLIAGLILLTERRWLVFAIFGVAIAINVWRIWPYSRFAEPEIALNQQIADAQCFTAYSANVKMENTDHARMAAEIERVDPDILFLTETDRAWIEALRPVLERYPTLRTHPQDDTFGKAFAARLPIIDTDIVERRGEDTPTLFALLRVNGGHVVEFVGLHPKAPLPGQNTEERDRSIMRAAEAVDGVLSGGIAMGDFNDVPWSYTSSAFRRQGGWKDPRIGRGTYPTFPSWMLPIGWPLDQIMVKGDVAIRSFEVMPPNGSDHRAIFAEFCVA